MLGFSWKQIAAIAVVSVVANTAARRIPFIAKYTA